MSRAEAATAAFDRGFSCSQAVLVAFAPDLGLDEETALKISAGFGGGMGGMGKMCGAVTGAYMVLSLKTGRTDPEDKETKEKTYALVRDFAARYEEKYGGVVCRDLLGADISTEDGLKEALRGCLFHTVCPDLVRGAAEILEEMLGELET